MSDPALSERDRDILEFERLRWRSPGAKEDALLQRFDMSPTRYYQVLQGLLDRPEAEAYDSELVAVLRRRRDRRRAARGCR